MPNTCNRRIRDCWRRCSAAGITYGSVFPTRGRCPAHPIKYPNGSGYLALSQIWLSRISFLDICQKIDSLQAVDNRLDPPRPQNHVNKAVSRRSSPPTWIHQLALLIGLQFSTTVTNCYLARNLFRSLVTLSHPRRPHHVRVPR